MVFRLQRPRQWLPPPRHRVARLDRDNPDAPNQATRNQSQPPRRQGTVRHRRGVPPTPPFRRRLAQGGHVRPARPRIRLAVRAARRRLDLGAGPATRRHSSSASGCSRWPARRIRWPGSRKIRLPSCSAARRSPSRKPATSARSRVGSSPNTAARSPTPWKGLTAFRGVGPEDRQPDPRRRLRPSRDRGGYPCTSHHKPLGLCEHKNTRADDDRARSRSCRIATGSRSTSGSSPSASSTAPAAHLRSVRHAHFCRCASRWA